MISCVLNKLSSPSMGCISTTGNAIILLKFNSLREVEWNRKYNSTYVNMTWFGYLGAYYNYGSIGELCAIDGIIEIQDGYMIIGRNDRHTGYFDASDYNFSVLRFLSIEISNCHS